MAQAAFTSGSRMTGLESPRRNSKRCLSRSRDLKCLETVTPAVLDWAYPSRAPARVRTVGTWSCQTWRTMGCGLRSSFRPDPDAYNSISALELDLMDPDVPLERENGFTRLGAPMTARES